MLFTRSRVHLASWLALLAIVLHTAMPFAQNLAGNRAMDGVFCGALTPAAKLALAKLPDGGQTLLKVMQHDCSLCQQASHSPVLINHTAPSVLVSLVLDYQVVVIPVVLSRASLNLAAAPPPSHAPPVLV